MAALGQNAKYSIRADVFRFASRLRHSSMRLALRICADAVEKVFSGQRTTFFIAAEASRARRCEGPHQITQKRPRTLVLSYRDLQTGEIQFREIFGAAQFPTFSTASAKSGNGAADTKPRGCCAAFA
jgi:hypothetical protein